MRASGRPTMNRCRRRRARYGVAAARFTAAIVLTATLAPRAQAQEPPPEQPRARDSGVVIVGGFVVDGGSDTPLRDVWVEVDGTAITALTDSTGTFVLPGVEPGRRTITFRRLGYYDAELQFDIGREQPLLRVPMRPEPVVLEGITVQVDRLDTRLRRIAASTRTFEGREILTSAASNPIDFVRGRFGLALMPCRGSPDRRCVWRRGDTMRPSIYVDEAPLPGGLEAFRLFPLHMFHRIEVIGRGAMIRAYTPGFLSRLARGETPLFPSVTW